MTAAAFRIILSYSTTSWRIGSISRCLSRSRVRERPNWRRHHCTYSWHDPTSKRPSWLRKWRRPLRRIRFTKPSQERRVQYSFPHWRNHRRMPMRPNWVIFFFESPTTNLKVKPLTEGSHFVCLVNQTHKSNCVPHFIITMQFSLESCLVWKV